MCADARGHMARETGIRPGRMVALRGGPPELPRLYRLPDDAADASRVVVAFYGQHQRFEATAETELVNGQRVPVFRFVYSTAIAE
ncbi:DUF5988 family protein [Streptomyces sp. NPDC055094]